MSLVPQFGFLELVLIGIIALIVVGPRDLPKLMRSAGRMAAKARALAAEFTAAFDQMARETEMDELRKELEALKRDNAFSTTKREFEKAVKPIQDDLNAEPAAVRDSAAAKPAEPAATSDADDEPAAATSGETAQPKSDAGRS